MYSCCGLDFNTCTDLTGWPYKANFSQPGCSLKFVLSHGCNTGNWQNWSEASHRKPGPLSDLVNTNIFSASSHLTLRLPSVDGWSAWGFQSHYICSSVVKTCLDSTIILHADIIFTLCLFMLFFIILWLFDIVFYLNIFKYCFDTKPSPQKTRSTNVGT